MVCHHDVLSQEGVGMLAINDSLSLEACVYVILRKYFKKESYYVDLLETFQEVKFLLLSRAIHLPDRAR